VQLDDGDLRYEAISYVWGDPKDRELIICQECVVSVTRSLFEALRRFRNVDTVRTLWADAICINQAANEERSSQVRLMNIIYRRALRVLAWLKHEEDDVVQAALNAIGRYLCAKEFAETVHYMWLGQDVAFISKEGSSVDVATIYDAVARICSTPWFGRGWVIQEVVLSSSTYLFWGHAQIEFKLIGQAAYDALTRSQSDTINHIRFVPINRCTLTFQLWCDQNHTGNVGSFLTLLIRTLYHKFSVPKDRIYGLLGLRTLECDPSDGQTFIDPDYTITTMECYRNVARKLLVERKNMRILSWFHQRPDMDVHWPTWVPDMSSYARSFVNFFNDYEESTYPAQISTEWRGVHECVSIAGFEVDVVDQEYEQYKEWSERLPDYEEVVHIKALLQFLETLYSEVYVACTFANFDRVLPLDTSCLDNTDLVDLEYLVEKFCTTRSLPRGDSDLHLGRLLSWYRSFMQWDPDRDTVLGDPPSEAESEALLNEELAIDFHTQYLHDTGGHVLFITREGMMGLGPEAMRPDDVVVVLHGAQVPFILRPADDGLWRLVGDCYLYDFQTGKIVKDWEERGSVTESFCIY
jgi:hypothetical protein